MDLVDTVIVPSDDRIDNSICLELFMIFTKTESFLSLLTFISKLYMNDLLNEGWSGFVVKIAFIMNGFSTK